MNTRKRQLIYHIANHYVNNYEGMRPADHFHGNTRYERALDLAIKDLKSLKKSKRHLESAPLNKLSRDLQLIKNSSLNIKPGVYYREAIKNFKKLQAQGSKKRRKAKRKKTKKRKTKKRKTKKRKTKRRKKLIKK